MASTFSELWNELKAEAVAEIAVLKAEGIKIEHALVPNIEAALATVFSQFKALAMQTALQFMRSEYDALTGHEKQSLVVIKTYNAAIAAGKNVAIQDVQAFGQQVYQAAVAALSPPAP